jgi:hypothetical protein
VVEGDEFEEVLVVTGWAEAGGEEANPPTAGATKPTMAAPAAAP